MTKNNENQEMKAIVNFTIFVDAQLSSVERGFKSNNELIDSVMGYKIAVDDLLGRDVLSYVYDQFITFYAGMYEARAEARNYFKHTAKMYKELR